MRFGIARPAKTEKVIDQPDRGPVLKPLGEDQYHEIEKALGYKFKEISWLKRAITHRSAPQEQGRSDYERLEFLGDAVFDLAVAHLLSEHHPEAREGELSKMRAALVNTLSLSEIAKKINLGPFIMLGKGELATGGHERPSILADVLEAVIGAIYLDAGYEAAKGIITGLFGSGIATVTPRDPKTELQELLHALGSEAPVYMLECVEGPEHAPTFVTVVQIDGEIAGRGRGPTKKASQQLAAEKAMEKLRGADEADMSFSAAIKDPSCSL